MKSVYKSQYNAMTGSLIDKKKAILQKPFDPKEYLTVGLSEREVELYKEVFDLFDVQGQGTLSPNDLRNALEMFGYHPKRTIVYQIISDIDSDESGGIGFKEFLRIMTDQNRPCDEVHEADYKQVFNYFADTKGYIEREDIEKVCMEINETMSPEELDDIMAKLDPVEKKRCDFLSFYKAMQEAIARKVKKRN